MGIQNEWQNLEQNGGVWRHTGDARTPHVVLRSGLHSNGFIDTLQYLSVVSNLTRAADSQVAELLKVLDLPARVDWVVGSPMAGIPFATAVGIRLNAKHVGFTEKKGNTDLVCRFDMQPGARVLHIEEMSTTGGTPQRSINAVLAKNPDAQILPYVGAFLTRCSRKVPDLTSAEFVPVIDLTTLDVSFGQWRAAECPLCAMGSKVLTNPKKVWWSLLKNMHNPGSPIPDAEYAP